MTNRDDARDGPQSAQTLADVGVRELGASLRLVQGDAIGPYTVLRLLGEGGFGAVYLCQQTEPVKRQVAIKVIKPGMDSAAVIARFEAERQALAIMDHSAIAKVYDAGATTEGRPYFVMEFIKGVSIIEYCDTNKLDTAARLKLFAEVCDGVHHAHQKGIIHRDLKPANILVLIADRDEPQPKIIDFGIAKATTQQLTEKAVFTQVGQMIGTPEYMSPEQAEMSSQDIDTRADIYSLGVVLYELLSGRLPFDPEALRSKGYAEIQRIIREEDPPKPSTRLTTAAGDDQDVVAHIARSRRTTVHSLSSRLRHELEWIPMKALRKDRSERYGSAAALGEDVRRYLRGDALEAGPETSLYRLRKLVRRHRGPVAAAALIGLALLAGIIGTTTFAVEASRERALAMERLDHLRTLVTQLSGPINDSVKNLPGGMEARRQLLEASRQQLVLIRAEAEASGDPGLLDSVGRTLVSYGDLVGGPRTASSGDRVEAHRHFDDALAVYRSMDPPAMSDEMRIMEPWILNRKADLLVLDDKPKEAAELIATAQTLLQPMADAGSVQVQRLYFAAFERLGDMAIARGDHEAALAHAQAHQQGIRRLLGVDDLNDPRLSRPRLRRDLAMTLRRTGFARGQLGENGEQDLRLSLAILLGLSEQNPEDLRRQRDVGWARLYIAQMIADDEARLEETARLYEDGATAIVGVCVAEPTVSEYRNDVVSVVGGVCEALVELGESSRAAGLRERTVLSLQPLVEQQPENVALGRVLEQVLAVSVGNP